MSRFHSYLNSSSAILSAYDGSEPFASCLKKYFALNKKFGSRDRKTIAHLCYCSFRTGKLFSKDPLEDRVLKSLLLCSEGQNEILEQLRPGWNSMSLMSAPEKYSLLSHGGRLDNIFPWTTELSKGINAEEFALSFLIQPDLFLRIRPGYTQQVVRKLKDAGILFDLVTETCVRLSNSTKVEEVIEINKEAVIQDHSSQRIEKFLQDYKLKTTNNKLSIWDCCAASGGKSILAIDTVGNIELSVSDIRESILINLRKRFKEAGITKYRSFLADLTKPNLQPPTPDIDLIIADVPCTGSGTWARTPEQLYFFDEKKIDHYAELQKKILTNITGSMKPGSFLLYITCSVFKKENEEAIAFLKKEFHLQCLKMESLIGYDKKADTMFACLLQKSYPGAPS
ncbi:MAG TPA: hypothetical protein VMZ03_05400 [Chitinophagaceae bacterium]|nr:hypothetical protein [Chitinophagaceae bacterium]